MYFMIKDEVKKNLSEEEVTFAELYIELGGKLQYIADKMNKPLVEIKSFQKDERILAYVQELLIVKFDKADVKKEWVLMQLQEIVNRGLAQEKPISGETMIKALDSISKLKGYYEPEKTTVENVNSSETLKDYEDLLKKHLQQA